MATHTITKVNAKELNDQQVSFQFRCCGDTTTDSWCTLDLALTAEQCNEAVTLHKTKMANQHEQKLQFRAGVHPSVTAAGSDTTVKI